MSRPERTLRPAPLLPTSPIRGARASSWSSADRRLKGRAHPDPAGTATAADLLVRTHDPPGRVLSLWNVRSCAAAFDCVRVLCARSTFSAAPTQEQRVGGALRESPVRLAAKCGRIAALRRTDVKGQREQRQ